ncbi:MAG: elongation factor P [Erysipelotrichaceae bacterium]|nr:elongation factor P [Erysipelotrichaceae bacterium]
MINSTEIKPGMYFEWEGNLYRCIDISLNKTAMAKMKVKVKVRNPRTGVVNELSLIGSDRVEPAHVERREMQYLYNTGDAMCFMDTETYEQVEIPADTLEWEKQFLTESMMVHIMVYQGSEILGITLPDKVELKIVECENAVKGDTATSASKNAVVETGLQVKVPLFIENEETIIVSTIDGKYSGRA